MNGERKNEWRELCSFFMSQPCFNLIIKSCVTHSHFLPYILLLIKHAVHEEHNFLPSLFLLPFLFCSLIMKENEAWSEQKERGRKEGEILWLFSFSSFHLITNECKGMRESSERKKEKEPRLCSLLFLFAFVLFVLPLHFITKEQMQRETKGQRHKINQQHEVDELSEKNPN